MQCPLLEVTWHPYKCLYKAPILIIQLIHLKLVLSLSLLLHILHSLSIIFHPFSLFCKENNLIKSICTKMASQVCETLAFINGDDGLKINGALLMSLMEEPSPSDESDDDRLDSLIRSFEAEISGSKMGDHHDSSSIGSEILMSNNIIEECASQSWNNNMGEIDGVECWANSSSSEFGVEWVDMDFVPSSPFEDRSWNLDPCGDEYAMANNFKGYDGFALGEHGYYNSLWQDMACN